jgi:hypothetical protein
MKSNIINQFDYIRIRNHFVHILDSIQLQKSQYA